MHDLRGCIGRSQRVSWSPSCASLRQAARDRWPGRRSTLGAHAGETGPTMANSRRSGSSRSSSSRSSRGKRTTQISGTSLVLAIVLVGIGFFARQAGWLDESTPAPTPFAAESGEGTIGIFVLPDDGREPILTELDAAERTVTLQVYLLSD